MRYLLSIYFSAVLFSSYGQGKYDEQGELEGEWVNKEVKIFKIREL
jgi:hypothetical protein